MVPIIFPYISHMFHHPALELAFRHATHRLMQGDELHRGSVIMFRLGFPVLKLLDFIGIIIIILYIYI
jgi:hypothetical protein